MVLCGSDDLYPALVPDIARRLKAASPAPAVVVAGLPRENSVPFSDAGVDLFIFLGANCLALNEALQQLTGVTHA